MSNPAAGVKHAAWLSPISTLIVCAIAIALFFRGQITHGFANVFGDRADGLIEIALLEHWWNVLRGVSGFRTTSFFYPFKDTLGYNDGYFIYGIVFSIFRGLRIDPLLSSDLTDLAVKVLGFMATCWFLQKLVRADRLISLTGAFIFTVADSTYVNVGHAQLLSVAFAPVLASLVVRLLDGVANANARQILIWGFAAVLFYDAWLLTAFYTAWFTAYFSVFFVIFFLVSDWSVTRILVRNAIRSIWPLAGVGVVGVVGCIPFLAVYLPTARETGMHPWTVVQGFQPSVFDVVNVGVGNLVYGHADRALTAALGKNFGGGEGVMGVTPGLLVLAVVGAFARDPGWSLRRRLMGIGGLTTLVTWLLTVRWGRWDIWPFFYAYLPGAKAVRVISRYEVLLVFPMIVLASSGLTAIRRRLERHGSVVGGSIALIIGGVVAVGQINDTPVARLSRAVELGRLYAVPRPPRGCKVFFTIRTRPGPILYSAVTDRSYSHNVDAMFMAEYLDLPTINGMGSFVPQGWNLLGSNEPGYMGRVTTYAASHEIPMANLCEFDLRDERWVRR